MQPISPFPPEPVGAPVMFQGWHCLTFFHWAYAPDIIARYLPPRLELDTLAGTAWVSLTPFLLEGLRPPFLPPLPWISRFPETNLRTYVIGPDRRRGIWFFSLDADRLLAVAGARLTFRLPYKWAAMRVVRKGDAVEYRSRRHDAAVHARVNIGAEIPNPSEHDHFLTARYTLYTVIAGKLAAAQVDHPPWPLRQASILRIEQTVTRAAGLPDPDGDPMVHFSPGVDTRVGCPKFV